MQSSYSKNEKDVRLPRARIRNGNKEYFFSNASSHCHRNKQDAQLSTVPCMPMAPSYISLAYLIDFRLIKLYLLPISWQSMEEVVFRFNLQ